MKSITIKPWVFGAVIAGTLLFATNVNAVLINITNDLGSPAAALSDFDKGLLGGLGDQQVADWLLLQVTSYNTFLNPGADFPPPVGLGVESSGAGIVDLTGFSYAVLHYGKGPGGIGQGGGLQAFFLNDMTGPFAFPATGEGPNGFGGLSFVRLYGPGAQVPEGGSTLILLGIALTGIHLAKRGRRKAKRGPG